MVNLRLSSREKPSGAPQANHFIPAGMAMGQSLPLVTPEQVKREPSVPGAPGTYEKPRGRMLIYWGCGEHAPAPTVIDFAKVAEGQIPPDCRRCSKMGRRDGQGVDARADGGKLCWFRRMAECSGFARCARVGIACRRPSDRGQLFASDRLHARAGAGLHAGLGLHEMGPFRPAPSGSTGPRRRRRPDTRLRSSAATRTAT